MQAFWALVTYATLAHCGCGSLLKFTEFPWSFIFLYKSFSKSTFRWKEVALQNWLTFLPLHKKKTFLMTLKLFLFDGWHPSRHLHYDVIEVKYGKQLSIFLLCSIALLYMLQRATWWREKGLCRAVGQRVEFTGFEWWSTTFSAHANTGPFQCNIRILPWLPLQKTDSKRPIKPLEFYFLPPRNNISFN